MSWLKIVIDLIRISLNNILNKNVISALEMSWDVKADSVLFKCDQIILSYKCKIKSDAI